MAKIALLKKTNEKLNESLRNESPNMTHLRDENEDLREENRELKEALDSSLNEVVSNHMVWFIACTAYPRGRVHRTANRRVRCSLVRTVRTKQCEQAKLCEQSIPTILYGVSLR